MKRRVFVLLLLGAAGAAGQPGFEPGALWSQATLYRDEWGTPHVYGETPAALGFAFGYAQAEDHLEGMLMAYRVANGRAAAVLGEAFADSDAFALKVGHGRLAREAFSQIDPITRGLCSGFALGVNTWIGEHPHAVPPWVEGVEPADILALWHAFVMSMAPFDLPDTYHRPRAMETGNAWALAPPRTAGGKAILVINPHQYYDIPFQWYEAHLVIGDLNVAGATLFGLPVIVQGHNEVLGWALTPNAPDTADLFVERIDVPQPDPKSLSPVDPLREHLLVLEYMSQSLSYTVRTHAGFEERHVPAMIVERGPVFEGRGGQLVSWLAGGYRDFGGLRQLFEMGRARSLEGFQDALTAHQIPCFHVVYADRAGNIFYYYNAKTGRKPAPESIGADGLIEAGPPVDWRLPVPSDWALAAWGEVLPPSALPRVVNPPSGYVQACGNPPWTATDAPPFQPASWPAWFAGDADTYRAKRVRQLLRSGIRSFRDNQSMLYDVVAPAAVDLVPALLRIAERRSDLADAHPDLGTGLQLLRNWNCVADTNAVGMTFYHVWWAMLGAQPAAQGLSDSARYGALLSFTPQAETVALTAAADAARMMRNDFDRLAIPWGEVHRIRRGSREEPIPGSGAGEPIFVASDYLYDQGRWLATYGYGYAMVVEFGEQPQAVSVSPFGASERPQSPHYADQLDLLLEKRFKRTRFQREAVWRYADSARGRHITLYPLGVEGAVTFLSEFPIEARLRSSVEPPGPLPAASAAFTLYVKPEWAPPAVPVMLGMHFHVPEILCRIENLDQLAIYGHLPGLGWEALHDQDWDLEHRLFSARQEGAGVYAVLGPAACLEEAATPAATPGRAPERAGSRLNAPAAGAAWIPRPLEQAPLQAAPPPVPVLDSSPESVPGAPLEHLEARPPAPLVPAPALAIEEKAPKPKRNFTFRRKGRK